MLAVAPVQEAVVLGASPALHGKSKEVALCPKRKNEGLRDAVLSMMPSISRTSDTRSLIV
ncbi:hypothetical protein D918_03185 [Trichuris suis]|nr:hypothetical protein D918_03185 [Trichuris suis]